MRRVVSILALVSLLTMGASVVGQVTWSTPPESPTYSADLDGPDEIEPYKVVRITLRQEGMPDGVEIDERSDGWTIDNSNADIMQVSELPGKLWFTGPPGKYPVEFMAALVKEVKLFDKDGNPIIFYDEDGNIVKVHDFAGWMRTGKTVTITGKEPGPDPGPDPDPEPGPKPPPIPDLGKLWVLIVRESEGQSISVGRITTSQEIRDYVDSRGFEFRVVDPDERDADGATPADIKPYLDAIGVDGRKAPHMFVTNEDAQLVYDGPLPGSIADTMSVLKGLEVSR